MIFNNKNIWVDQKDPNKRERVPMEKIYIIRFIVKLIFWTYQSITIRNQLITRMVQIMKMKNLIQRSTSLSSLKISE